MEEKRREKRLPIDMRLEVSSLFKQDNILIENIDAPIRVVNISKSGIGFVSKSALPLGFHFNSCIQMGEAEDAKLYCVAKIIRKGEPDENGETSYGCELIGVAPVLSYIFEDYEKSLEA